VVRTAVQALAAVLGGAQSLHTNSLDEAYALPQRARRYPGAAGTQQVDRLRDRASPPPPTPWGGSYFLGASDARPGGRPARDYIRRIDEMGGMIAAIEQGFPQSEDRQRPATPTSALWKPGGRSWWG